MKRRKSGELRPSDRFSQGESLNLVALVTITPAIELKSLPPRRRIQCPPKQKERRTTAAPTTPTKGRNRTAHGRRPHAGAGQHCFCCFKSLSAQVRRLVGS